MPTCDTIYKILNMKIKYITLFFLHLVMGGLSFGQSIVLTQSNETGIYKKGEKIQVTVTIKDSVSDSLSVEVRKNFVWECKSYKLKYTGNPIVLLSETFNEPTSLIFEVRLKDQFASTGLVVDPENFIPALKRPDDFNRFWKNEKKTLRALPMHVKIEKVNNTDSGFVCSNIELNCSGTKPARGYFAKPVNAKPKSLPIVLQLHAAGVKGSWCLAQPISAVRYAKMGKGALSFDLNAHGMLNGQSQSYYDKLDSLELKNYPVIGIESRNDYYFKGMYLRLLRTLDFLCSQPEWDGKRILVMGESQGGGQALVAAGLDSRITAVVATVPAMCDWGAALVGRGGGWPNPFSNKYDKEKMLNTLPYFDAANLLQNSKATIFVEIGFIDITCPSISVYAAINQAKGKKLIYGVPYRGHQLSQKWFKETWENTVNKPKNEFIEDCLK
jgi:cephalosporin-C deacetylase